ncbi:MAG TPA: PAS domain S-box protein [Steroidobacteraceae bacterium]|jgi:two-component system sensor kinase FixL|nr:PAS domain S-box protein [Steroidobacteraceae bacterium]
MGVASSDVLALLEATFDAVVVMDDRGRITAFNRSAEEMFGYRAADTLGRNVSMLMTSADRAAHDDHLRRHLATGESHILGKGRDVRVRHRDGSEFSVFLSVGRIPRTEPPQFVGYLHDTSLRRKALATLEQERQLNRLYLDLAQVMLVALDRTGTVQLVNQRAVRVLRMSDSAIMGHGWVEACVAPDDRPVARAAVRSLLMSGGDEPLSCEYHVRASDGEDRYITWRGVALRDADNVATGVLLSGEDITDQRRAEGEAHRALERMNSVSRLATMGEMAAGISHELNQPLAAIANYSQACARLLRLPAPDMPEISGALEQISAQALRAGEIIRRIRSLVRNEDVRRELQDINDLIREVHALLASDARVHDGRLEMDLAPVLPRVTVDGVQIQQVLMNLVHNAFEAQVNDKGGERLRAPAGSAALEVRISTRATDGGDVEVAVSDLGPGLDGDVEQKIFEPFFTTKATGTGLGLAISRSIIKAHAARLGYRANQPRGACFFFVLPAHSESAL